MLNWIGGFGFGFFGEQVVGEGNKVVRNGGAGGAEAQVSDDRDGGSSHGHPC